MPDRLFASVADAWKLCTSALSEVKELIPEFFSCPAFLKNVNGYGFGSLQDGSTVVCDNGVSAHFSAGPKPCTPGDVLQFWRPFTNLAPLLSSLLFYECLLCWPPCLCLLNWHRQNDVVLPPWAQSPEDFIEKHREALESEHVSAHLHEWIDLVFGYKQRGPEAVKADNVFYYLTYVGAVNIDAIEDPGLRLATELQIAHFGCVRAPRCCCVRAVYSGVSRFDSC